MTLDDTANAVLAKLNELNQKIREINGFMGVILFKQVVAGETLEWPSTIEQAVYGYYQTARAELIALASELPP